MIVIVAGTIFLHARPACGPLVIIGGLQRLEVLPRDLAADQAGDGQHHLIQPLGHIDLTRGIPPIQRAVVAGLCFPPLSPRSIVIEEVELVIWLHIYRIFDLPYQSQIVPLAAILADIGDAWEHEANRAKLVQWYWNGVFGELYGSAVETRIAKDVMEVPRWLSGGPEPSTVRQTRQRIEQCSDR